jgi:Asp/Glu/hydantoin racemase
MRKRPSTSPRRADILAGGEKLVTQHDHIGAVVLECTNMVPFTRALNKRLGLPVYDIYAFVNWFHAGLNPRGFNLPGDPL